MTVALPTVIVGSVFRGPVVRTALTLMRAGETVLLEREPDNRHDPLAVACHYLGRHIGYLPRQVNRRVAEAIDAGLDVRCTVKEPPVVILGPRIRTEPRVIVEWEEAAPR